MMRFVEAHSVFELTVADGAFWCFVTAYSLMVKEKNRKDAGEWRLVEQNQA